MAVGRLQEELEAIREDNGGLLRAGDVVEWAQANPESELHSRFTWDDALAGAKFRLNQARSIIRVAVFVQPGSKEVIRTYVSLESDRQLEGGGYRHLGEAMTNTDRRNMLLRQALLEFQRLRAKYKALKELASLFASIDELNDIEHNVLSINADTLAVELDDITPS